MYMHYVRFYIVDLQTAMRNVNVNIYLWSKEPRVNVF